MKILITSDNHLGYKETDTIRQDDSFNTFDEILQLGVINKVDIILQVGDLFHENRPSRYCINRTINILRKHIVDEDDKRQLIVCKEFDDKKQHLDLNDQITNLSSFKVKIPFLCIHGNHDDPSGFNKISTLDILHSAGLVNYIGKNPEICDYIQYDKIRIYGVGYVKDKNVTDIFKKIQYKNLSTDYFNILLVHQNRVPRNKDFLCPSVIPESFNLLIYGHEHDPVILRNETMLLQCGSTVRTSLSEAECNEKYCYILEGNILNKIRLNSVRPFIMEDTNIVEEKDLIEKIDDLLTKNQNITYQDDCKRQKSNETDDSKLISVINLHNPLNFPPLLPLVRLRILTTNVLNINKNRLSHVFKDKISNPSEIIKLIPHKKVKGKASTIVYQSQHITEIIANHLKCTPLECIPEFKFIEYFNKDSSFVEMVENNVEDISRNIQFDNCMASDLGQEIRKIKMELCRANQNKTKIVEKEAESLESDLDSVDEAINSYDDDIENIIGLEEDENSSIKKEVDLPIKDIKITSDKSGKSNVLTGKDSKTLRKSLNNKPLLNNFKKDDLVSDFSKASSPFFTSGFSDLLDKSTSKLDNETNKLDHETNKLDHEINKPKKSSNEVDKSINIVNKSTSKIDASDSFLHLEDEKILNNSEVRKIFSEESDSTDLLIDF